jgi:hypothetical protein
MKDDFQVLFLLNNIENQKSLNKLIELSYKIAYHYLNFNVKRIKRLLEFEGITLKEFAIESIEMLFIKNPKNEQFEIINSFRNWQPPIETDGDALNFLIKITHSRVEQHISKAFRDIDPFYSKILNQLFYLMKTNNCKKLNYLGRQYIVKNDIDILHGKVINDDDFNKIPLNNFADRKNLLQNIFDYIQKETDYAQAIPFDQLIFKLKANVAITSMPDEDSISIEFDKNHVEEIVNKALEDVLIKVKKYVQKGKITEYEFDIFKETLYEIAIDLKNGGINRSLHKYFLDHYTEINFEIYKEKYQYKLEYFFKLLKENIIQLLKQ